MSLAVLAKKTRAKRSKKYRSCFVLNMTGRGGVIGQNAKYNSGARFNPCDKCHSGTRTTCCGGNMLVSRECRRGCSCWHGGSSQPAPQMSYRTYINRKANGAYRPGGSYPCCETDGVGPDLKSLVADDPSLSVNQPKRITWKQSGNLDSSTITEQRKLAAIQCSRYHTREARFMGGKMMSNKLVAKATACPARSEPCQCYRGLKIKSRLGYTRINHNWCESTKASACAQTASDHTALVKSEAFSCNCPTGNGCGLSCTCTQFISLPGSPGIGTVLVVNGVERGLVVQVVGAGNVFSVMVELFDCDVPFAVGDDTGPFGNVGFAGPVEQNCTGDGTEALNIEVTAVMPDPDAPNNFEATAISLPKCVSISQGRSYKINLVPSPSVVQQFGGTTDWTLTLAVALGQSYTPLERYPRLPANTDHLFGPCRLYDVVLLGPTASPPTSGDATIILSGGSLNIPDCPPFLGQGFTGRWTKLVFFREDENDNNVVIGSLPFRKCFDNLKKPMPSTCK